MGSITLSFFLVMWFVVVVVVVCGTTTTPTGGSLERQGLILFSFVLGAFSLRQIIPAVYISRSPQNLSPLRRRPVELIRIPG